MVEQTATSIRERALAALREHEEAVLRRQEAARTERRAESLAALFAAIQRLLGIDASEAPVAWTGYGELDPVATVEGVRFRMVDDDYQGPRLHAQVLRVECGHTLTDVIGEQMPWVNLGDVLQHLGGPCRQCAAAEAKAGRPVAPPAPATPGEELLIALQRFVLSEIAEESGDRG